MKIPRFSLRDLFWLVLVCALAVGWWMERNRKVAAMNREWESLLDEVRQGFVKNR